MFLEYFPAGPIGTNAILIGCRRSKRAAIVDAPPGSGDSLYERAAELGFELQMVLLTHSHWDHTGDVAYLKKKWGLPLYVHPLDAKNVEEPGSDGLPLMMAIQPAKPDHFLNEGDKLMLGELVIEVIHTPGHSPGSVCFYLREQGTLLSGDTLFQGSIGNLSLPTAEPEKMWSSLEKLAKLPPNTRVIPGHGDETTIGAEEWLPQAKEIFGG